MEHFEEALERVDLIILQSTSSTLCIPILTIYTRFVSYGRCWTRTMVCCVVLCCAVFDRADEPSPGTDGRVVTATHLQNSQFTQSIEEKNKLPSIVPYNTSNHVACEFQNKFRHYTTFLWRIPYIPVAVRDIAEIAPLRGYVVSTVVRKMMRPCSCTFGPTVKYSILL